MTPERRPTEAELRAAADGPLDDGELDAIRQRDANAQRPARTWAVEDRRRLLATLDGARAAALRELLTNVEYLMEDHGTRVIDIEDLRAVAADVSQ